MASCSQSPHNVVFCDSISVLAEYQAQLTEKKNIHETAALFLCISFFSLVKSQIEPTI